MKTEKAHLAEGVLVFARPLGSSVDTRTPDYSIGVDIFNFNEYYELMRPFYFSLSATTQKSIPLDLKKMGVTRNGVLYDGGYLDGQGTAQVTVTCIKKQTLSSEPQEEQQKAGTGSFKDFMESDGSNESILWLVKKYGFLTRRGYLEPLSIWQATIQEFKLAKEFIVAEQYDELSFLLNYKVRTSFFCTPKASGKRHILTEDEKEERRYDLEDTPLKDAPLNCFLLLPDLLSNLWYSFIKHITSKSKLHMCLNPDCDGEKWFLSESWDARCRVAFCKQCVAPMTAKIYRAGKKWAALNHVERNAVLSSLPTVDASNALPESEWKNIKKTTQVKMLPLLIAGKGRPQKHVRTK